MKIDKKKAKFIDLGQLGIKTNSKFKFYINVAMANHIFIPFFAVRINYLSFIQF